MYRWSRICIRTAIAVVGCSSSIAFAQRANENIITTAEDAFGTRVGSENIGLYSPTSTRGFNPMLAGNVRIEGLYFDQQAFIGRAIAKNTTMRVGLSAQSYPFPAPTGIADTALFAPDNKESVSVINETRWPTGLNVASLDVKTPVTDTLDVAIGGSEFQVYGDGRATGQSWNISTIWRWRPLDNLEIIPFGFFQRGEGAEVAPSVFTGGAYLPPRIDRKVFSGQEWADRSTDDLTAGIVMRGTPLPNWRLQMGLFRSDQAHKKDFVVFFRNVQPNGTGALDILRYPEHDAASTSGEARASGVFTEGAFRHTVHVAVRARDTDRIFGGGTTISFGPTTIGVNQPRTEPNYVLGVPDRDLVKQITPGVSYVGQWANIGEFSVGLQKSFYRRAFGKLGASTTTTNSQPWLYNGTLTYYATPKLAFYGGYTRGLEEFGNAPANAANGGAPLPAQLTQQLDGGVRYTIVPGINLMAGVFEVKKPYFDRDATNIYTVVGDLRHRGAEVSLTGKPFEGLTVVIGAVLLKARVSGLPVEQGLIGAVAPGTAPRLLRFNLQYGAPSWKGFTVETNVDHDGAQFANRANTFRVPSHTTISVGARYPFTIGETHANVRLQVNNVADTFGWTVDGNSGRFADFSGRQFALRVAADF